MCWRCARSTSPRVAACLLCRETKKSSRTWCLPRPVDAVSVQPLRPSFRRISWLFFLSQSDARECSTWLLMHSSPFALKYVATCTCFGCYHRAIFANFGALKLVDMSHDASTGRHKGFCFIEYVDERAADAALRAMNGFELAGRAIKVG